MDIEIDYSYHPNYLMAKVSGNWTQSSVRYAIDQITETAKQAGLNRILVDFLSLSLPGENLLRFETGSYIAQMFRPPFRAALVGGRPDQVNRFVETVASNRGARIRVFVEMEPALAWLLSDTIPIDNLET